MFQILPSKITRDRGEWLDEKLLRSSRDKYAELGLPRSEKKPSQKNMISKPGERKSHRIAVV